MIVGQYTICNDRIGTSKKSLNNYIDKSRFFNFSKLFVMKRRLLVIESKARVPKDNSSKQLSNTISQ